MTALTLPKFLLGLVLTTGFIYLLLLPANTPLYDLIMFPCPDPRTPDVAGELSQICQKGITCQDITLKSANGKLIYGWFFELPGTRRVFLYSQGKGNNRYRKLHMVAKLLKCGGSVLIYDYQGWGHSQGRASVQGSCDDAVAAYDYLVQTAGRKPGEIIAYGESFGSGVTGQLAIKRKVAAVILMSGFASLKSVGRETYPLLRLYPDCTFPSQIMDNTAVFSKPHVPLLMIHGQKDQVISFANAKSLFEAAIEPKEMLVLEQGRHVSFGNKGEWSCAIKNFIAKYNL